jgi:hypothetical protein
MESITNLTNSLPKQNTEFVSMPPLNFSIGSLPPGISLGPSLAIPQHLFIFLLLIYIIVICLASFGSLLVSSVVVRANHLRTHSNCYLVNLAISDLLLVLVACPATLSQVSSSYWPFPSLPILCKLATFLPLLFSFASTFSICLIALDRHQLIVHTQNPRHKTVITSICILSVWISAFSCAAPILPNTKLNIVPLSQNIYSLLGIKERAYCMENWGYKQGRLVYSLLVLCVQFLMPSIILLLAHVRIYLKLTSLPFWGRSRSPVIKEGTEIKALNGENHKGDERKMSARKRSHKTIYLLVCVVVLFMCSWFPLNLLNVLLDLGFYSKLFR